MSWYVWFAIIAAISFVTYVITVMVSLFRRNEDLTQGVIDEQDRQREIENGVIKNNVKADNSKSGSDLDDRVRDKYGNR